MLAVLDHGSLAGAAERLSLPRSTLRRRLDRLEAWVGAELFHRGAHGATPTPTARALAEEARPLLDQLHRLPERLARGSQATADHIHLLVPPGLPPEVLTIGLRLARDTLPSLRLELSPGEIDAAGLPDGVDVAFHFGPTPPRGPYRTRVLARMPERLLASPALLARLGTPRTLDELRERPLLCWRPPGSSGRLLPLLAGGFVEVEPLLVSSDIHAVRLAAQAGMGIAFLPDGELPLGLGVDGLQPLLEDLVGDECALRLVIAERTAETARVREVVRVVENILGQIGLG